MEASSHHRSCFVVAPTGTPIAPFLEALRKSRFEPFFISDFLTSRNKAVSQVRTAFRSVDFVVGLLFAGRPLESTFFELGIALGLARPTIIFADFNVAIGDVFGGIEIRRVNLSNLQALVPAVELFLRPKLAATSEFKPIPARGYEIRAVRKPRPRPEQLQVALKALKEAQNTASPLTDSQLESEITRTFASAGLAAVQARRSPSSKSHVPDLALWIDDVQKEIGNPIAVEIKLALEKQNLPSVASQLSMSLESVGATAGILIHAGPSLNQPYHVVQASPLILIFSIDELTQFLEDGSFAAVLKNSSSAAISRTS
jgi:hypothetical protein